MAYPATPRDLSAVSYPEYIRWANSGIPYPQWVLLQQNNFIQTNNVVVDNGVQTIWNKLVGLGAIYLIILLLFNPWTWGFILVGGIFYGIYRFFKGLFKLLDKAQEA